MAVGAQSDIVGASSQSKVLVMGASGFLILPANDGHPAKRVHYATEVNHDEAGNEEDIPESVFTGIQG